MGSDDFFKKKKAVREKRKSGNRSPRANSFLIVSEGTRTEPLYFGGMKKLIEEKIGGTLDVVEIPLVDVQGKGCSTRKLIEVTEQIVKEAKVLYQNVWVVFDKDDFLDFDEAIKEAKIKDYNVAWSNQSFEYWIYLHFHYSDTAMHRNGWNKKLDEIFKQYKLGEGTYEKNYEEIYNILNDFGGVIAAIKNAKRRMKEFEYEKHKPSEYDPGTTVHELVEELNRYLQE